MQQDATPEKLDFSIHSIHEWRVITIHDKIKPEVDISQFKELVNDLLQEDASRIAFVFERCSYLYSRIIAILVTCAKQMKQHNSQGRLAIIAENQYTEKVLDKMCITADLVEVYHNTEELEHT